MASNHGMRRFPFLALFLLLAAGALLATASCGTTNGDGDGQDRLEVTGCLTDEGVECQALRADDGELYTLTGDLGGATTGQRVTVTGTRAEVSICQQGTTIEVSSARILGTCTVTGSR